REVVVHGLRYADDRDAGVGQALGSGEGAFAADRDERVDSVALHDLGDALGTAVVERVGAARAQDRAALLADAHDLLPGQRHDEFFANAFPAAAEPDELVAIHLDAGEHDPADYRVQSWCVATA